MKLSTTTGLYHQQKGTRQLRDLNVVFQVLADAGFQAIDVGFCFPDRPGYILGGDGWEKRVEELGNTAAKLGLELYQCHLPFVRGCSRLKSPQFQTPGFGEYFDECTRRAYIASGMLGIPWAVAHPLTFVEYNFETKASLEGNHQYSDPMVELGIKHNVGTAFENMLPSMDRKFASRYCQYYDQLIELADSFHDPMVGICWDTGHANQMQFDQGRALRSIGSRLKTLHINDNNYGHRDEHLLPFMGDVDWNAVVEALVDIGYTGTLNYETGKVATGASGIGGEFEMSLVRATYDSCKAMRELYEKVRRERTGAK